MNARDVFNLIESTHSYGFDQIADVYWELERMLADESGAPYSWLIDCTRELRTCHLCGTVCGTDYVGCVRECDYKRCNDVRSFLGICAFPHVNILVSSGPRKKRSESFRKKLNRDGYKKVSEIPRQIRFEYCVKSMLEIIANEKNDTRSA